jgi:DnaK suppressor protein
VAQRKLSEVSEKLTARRAELVARQARVDRDLARKNESLVADSADRAIQLQNDEVLSAIGAGARDEIASIDEALARIKANVYGICDRCGKAIPYSRLEVAPSVTHCATCAEIAEAE